MTPTCFIRARSGDRTAKEELICRLRPRLARMAAYYAGRCRQDADDLLQEAWAGLLEALPTLDPRIGDPEQYLLRYARWRLLDAVRRAGARFVVQLDEDGAERIPAPPELDRTLDGVALSAFLPRLTDTQRDVLGCLLTGLTWREAGRALGCSSANVAYHVRQIRAQYSRWCAQSPEHPLALAGEKAIERMEACSHTAASGRRWVT